MFFIIGEMRKKGFSAWSVYTGEIHGLLIKLKTNVKANSLLNDF